MSINEEFFSGANRAEGYVEGAVPTQHQSAIPPVPPTSPAPPVPPLPYEEPVAVVPDVTVPVITPAPNAPVVDSADSFRRRIETEAGMPLPPRKKLFGNKKAQRQYQQDLEMRRWETYRQDLLRSHPRSGAATVLVVNSKGGVGKTPTVLCLTHALAAARNDGSVAVWEAADERGTLLDRVAGPRGAGIMAMLDDARELMERPSQVRLDTYAAKLASGARVFGSPDERDLLQSADIETIHAILSSTYAINIVDTANALRSSAFRQALNLADVVVIPTVVSVDSAARMLKTIELLRKPDPVGKIPFRPELSQRVVVVITHSIKDVDPYAVQFIADAINELGVPFLQVPYDQHIRDGLAIEWDKLSAASRQAWSDVAVQVMATVQSVDN